MSRGRWLSLSGKKMKARLKSEMVAEAFAIACTYITNS